MPILAALLGSMFSGIVVWLGGYLTKRAANYVAMTLTTAVAFAAAWVAIRALISAASVSVPADVVTAAGWIMPGNVDELVALRLGVEAALAGYRWHKETVRASAAVA